ncbi:MAG: LytTR family transcriptional regulator [Tannerella sp.]|nr:LytTR family transcriptional regulator [Tannerella sp.]
MQQLFKKIKSLLGTSYPLLISLRERMLFAAGVFVFCVLFIFLFIPFNISEWISYTSPIGQMQLPMLGVICGIIIFSSQGIQYLFFRNRRELKIYHFLFGFVFDVLYASIPLSYLYSIPANSYWTEFVQTVKIIAPLTTLYYFLGGSILAIIQLRRFLSAYTVKRNVTISDRINICDENGQLRLSLKPEDLLLFESADNYVMTYFRKDQRVRKEMIRTSLKNIETELSEYKCIRCHRSFVVNMQNVHSIKKSGRSYVITIQDFNQPIPISRGYVKIIKYMLSP